MLLEEVRVHNDPLAIGLVVLDDEYVRGVAHNLVLYHADALRFDMQMQFAICDNDLHGLFGAKVGPEALATRRHVWLRPDDILLEQVERQRHHIDSLFQGTSFLGGVCRFGSL